jgi:hypothetical protein
MTTEEKRERLMDICRGVPCPDCEILSFCCKSLSGKTPLSKRTSDEEIERLYNEVFGGETMKNERTPEIAEDNAITISRSEYGRLRTAEAELEARQRESSNTVTLDRSEYNMLIKAQGLLDVVRTSYKTASADYRLCEFLDIIFKDEEEK